MANPLHALPRYSAAKAKHEQWAVSCDGFHFCFIWITANKVILS
jgi:hypothetical protein